MLIVIISSESASESNLSLGASDEISSAMTVLIFFILFVLYSNLNFKFSVKNLKLFNRVNDFFNFYI